ncbi:MAG TPA: SURF1 family protein [Ilumatobacteraceae bacterium]|nr:SURF1 family protein [Ilumatobacteraceae bacterium]HRB01888.1 SURF1 family protein [Ilumatobacteraceae bacterium]
MYSFLLKPKWIGFHLLCLGGVVGMISLGLWQLRRLDEKQTFNRQVTEHTNADVMSLNTAGLTGPADELSYRRVSTSGTYLRTPQFEVVNVTQDGTTGRDVVNALQLADGSLILVNRGFVATGTPLTAPPTGEVQLLARLKEGQVAGTGQPSDDGTQALTQVRRVDLVALGQQFERPLAPMYLELLESAPAEPNSVRPIAFPELGEGPHLSYAVQWAVFSISVAVGWVLAVRKSIQTHSGRTAPKKRRGPPPIADEFR